VHVVLLHNQEARFRDAAVSQAGDTAAYETLGASGGKRNDFIGAIFLKDFPEQKLIW